MSREEILSEASFVVVEIGIQEGPIEEDELGGDCIPIEDAGLILDLLGEVTVDDHQLLHALPLALPFLKAFGKFMERDLIYLHLCLRRGLGLRF